MQGECVRWQITASELSMAADCPNGLLLKFNLGTLQRTVFEKTYDEIT